MSTIFIPLVLAPVLALLIFVLRAIRRPAADNDDVLRGREAAIGSLAPSGTYQCRALEVVLDVCLAWIAYYAAYRLRFGNGEALQVNFERFRESLPVVLAAQIVLLAIVGVYRTARPASGMRELVVVGRGVLLQAIVAQIALLYVYGYKGYWGYSRGVFLIDAALLLLLLVSSRAALRWIEQAPRRWRHGDRQERFGVLLVAACVATGVAWGAVVPPFEAPDEIYISRLAFNAADGAQKPYDPMFFALLKPLVRVGFDAGITFDAPSNPAFRFVSNKAGQVNMFLHGRLHRPRGRQLLALYALRALAIALSTATILLIYLLAARFFSHGGMGLMVAGLCLFTPQFSFMASKAHPEGLATLWGAAVSFVLIARATGRLSRGVSWTILIPLVLVALITDSVAYFLLAFVPIAMVLAERDWHSRLATARVIATVALACGAAGYLYYASLSPAAAKELEKSLVRLHLVNLPQLAAPSSLFLAAPDTPRYFLFEFAPKLFFGFWGWLGQPSILLPAWTYAILLDLGALAALGLLGLLVSRPATVPASLDDDQRRVLTISAIGVGCMLLPIVSATMLWNRNAWYGRWLFPLIGPMMLLLTVGLREFVGAVRKRPHFTAAWLAAVAAAIVLFWMTGPGNWVRAGIRGNHYGDQVHLIRTVRNAVFGIALIPLLIELIVLLKAVGPTLRERTGLRFGVSAPVAVFITAWALNLLLLFGFVRPLYRPLDAAGYLAAIQEEVRLREFKRAAGLAKIAIQEYPLSTEFARLVPEMMLRAGEYDELKAYFQSHVAGGMPIESRPEWLALARAVRVSGWREKDSFSPLLRVASERPDLAEETALLRLALDGTDADAPTAEAVLRQVRAVTVGAPLREEGVIEGFTIRPLPDGRRQVVVYFRPLRDWADHRLWIHAYPAGSQTYVDLGAYPPAFHGWNKGELAWEAFETPQKGRFTLYAGIAVGDDLGPGHALGAVGAPAQQMAPPALLRARQFDELRQYFQERLAGDALLTSRADLVTLARLVRSGEWPDKALFSDLPRPSSTSPDLLEGWALLRSQVDPALGRDHDAAVRMLQELRGVVMGTQVRDQILLEGYTNSQTPDGRSEVVIYFRPIKNWTGRRLWVHAYPAGSQAYVDLGADPPPFGNWQPGELAWEVFDTPDGRPFNLYVGVAVADDLGTGVPLGWVGRAPQRK